MSDFRGHLQAGLFVASVAVASAISLMLWGINWLSWQELPIIFAVAVLGSLWPDADIGSKSQRYVYIFFLILDLALIFVFDLVKEAALFGIFTMLPSISKHRGFTHSFRANMVVGLLWLVLPFIGTGFLIEKVQVHHYRDLIWAGVPYYFAFLAGVASHLVLDRHPFFKRRRSVARKTIKTTKNLNPKIMKGVKA